MEAAMKKYFSLLAVLGCLTMASAAFAQLPTNPWSPKPNDGYFEDVANKPAEEGVPTIPEYSGGQTNGEVLPVDPWAKSRDRSGVKTWRGSAKPQLSATITDRNGWPPKLTATTCSF